MERDTQQGVEKYTKARQMKKLWYRVMSFLAAVVVFCTTYALILPAVTLEGNKLTGDDAYVTSFTISNYSTGTAPFDDDNKAGNDKDDKNNIVRTFDTVTYTINVAYDVYKQGDTFTDARVWLEFVLPVNKSQAEFDLAAMGWLEDYELTEVTSGGTTRQVLTGYKHLLPSETTPEVVPGDFKTNVTVNIKMMRNEDTIAPTFSAAMEHNTLIGTCEKHKNHAATKGQEKKTVTAKTITVSAAPKYNVQLKQAYATEASMEYDFSEGSSQLFNNGNAMNLNAGQRPGRIFVMGVTLQLYNDTTQKQLRGIELPTGDITFDIKLSSEFQPVYSTDQSTTETGTAKNVTDDYTPLVWSYGPQAPDWSSDRDTSMTSYSFAYGSAAPWNKADDRDSGCYNGGTWTAEQKGDTIHFTVKDYDFDGVFPCTDAGNTSASTTYYNKESGIRNIGCFSAMELYIVQPYTNNSGKGVLEDFSAGGSNEQGVGTGECIDGKFIMTVADVNLQATSVSDQSLDNVVDNSNQGAQNDDKLDFTVAMKSSGSYQQRLLYSHRDHCNMVDIFGVVENQPGSCALTGDDWAVIGTDFRLTFGGYALTNGEDANKMCAAKWLLKFDPEAIELDPGTYALGAENYDYKFLYAVKPDGSGWVDDEELKKTSMLQLKYYNTIEEAENAGNTIVGILVEAEPKTTVADISSNIVLTYFSQNAKVKDDANLAGKRFIITAESMIWTVDKYNEAINTIGNIPSLLEYNPSEPNYLPPYTFYNKPVYSNGDGIYDRHGYGYNEGDTLLVLSCKATIFKNVEQKLPNSTDEKINYNLDADQRVIDFVLEPKVETGKPIPEGSQTATVTVTIEDTLPEYLTYRHGSCYFGGTYRQTSDNGGTQGEVTGGELNEPTVVNNSDGTQTLTWTITDVPVGQSMNVIHYSVNIGTKGDEDKDVPIRTINQTNTAKISVVGSDQPQSVAYGNVAEKGVMLTRGNVSAYGKYSKNAVVEPDGEINYVIFYNNNSAGSVSDIVLLDTMPYNGKLGNNFTGSYSVTSWKLDVNKCKTSNFTLYYTTDTTYAGKTFIADGATGDGITKAQIKTWETATIGVDGSVTDMNGETPPVAWALIGNLSASEGAYVDLTIKLNPGEFNGKNNVYHNTFSNSVNQTVTTTEEHSVVRSLEGLTWKDDNADGVQDSNETKLSGVNVSLWKLREGTKFTQAGESDDVQLYFNLGMLEGLSAENLGKIRIVASGIPADQSPQLFYATNNAGLDQEHSKILNSTTTAETEYVYYTSEFNNWSGSITCLRWDPFQKKNQSFTLKSITFELNDGTSKVFDFTVQGAFQTYLANIIYLNVVGYGDPYNEADYSEYCYPGTSTPVSVETGKQISVLAQSDAVAYEAGRYKFNYLPAGIFAVKFQDGTRTISNYIASPANRGSDVTKDSNGIATYSDDRSQLLKTVILGIEMPKAEEMPVVLYESKYHDSGFYERGYELPKSGGTGTEIYTAGGFLMLTSAAFVLLNKQKRRIKRGL